MLDQKYAQEKNKRKSDGEYSPFLTLSSFPALPLFLAAVVPKMSFISPSPPMPDTQTPFRNKEKS